MVAGYLSGQRSRDRELFDLNLAKGEAGTDLKTIVPAAINGRIAVLWVADDAEQYGTYEEATNGVALTEADTEGATELFNLATTRAVQSGARVYVEPQLHLPRHDSKICAIYRYTVADGHNQLERGRKNCGALMLQAASRYSSTFYPGGLIPYSNTHTPSYGGRNQLYPLIHLNSTTMIKKYLFLLLLSISFAACETGVAERSNDDNREPATTDPDGVFSKSGGETSTWEDQSARSEVTTKSTTREAPDYAEEPRDTTKYLRTPESHSTSPVKKDTTPDSKEN